MSDPQYPATDRLLQRLSPDQPPVLVWTNSLAGRTYRLSVRGQLQYLKLAPADAPASHDQTVEADKLRWVRSLVPVPTVLDAGRDSAGTWLRTRAMPGIPASGHRWRNQPQQTARALGLAVRLFHDRLAGAVPACPWSWRIADRLILGAGSARASAMAAEAPVEVDLVVAHGDLCAPNVLLTEHGDLAGFVDLGNLGVADRAADLGCLEYNGLGDVIDDFLSTYGDHVDRQAVQWYRNFYTIA